MGGIRGLVVVGGGVKFISAEQMRAADQATIERGVASGQMLMARAGVGVARVVVECARVYSTNSVVVVVGHGNNGGDGCVVARALFEDGYHVQVLMTCVPATLKGDARAAWDDMRVAGVPYMVLSSEEAWQDDLPVVSGLLVQRAVIVDSVMGTGCSGRARGVAACAIRWINAMRPHAMVVAVDLPSGMDGNSGVVAGDGVVADLTATLARPKQCFLNQGQSWRVGHLAVVDIGIPDDICDHDSSDMGCELIAVPELAGWLPQRKWRAHKGVMGHVVVVGGSRGMPHAPILAGMGALRSGAGLVTVGAVGESMSAAGCHLPEAMVAALPLDSSGEVVAEAWLQWIAERKSADVVVVGPGLGVGSGAEEFMRRLLGEFKGRLVVDADGLNLLAAGSGEWQLAEGLELILTPHPGEAARLLGSSVADVEGARIEAVKQLAKRYAATVVLKGAGTLVAAPGGGVWLNMTGNPGMASGGMGDVLSGVIGALWGQGVEPERAAALGVWSHGCAGDMVMFSEGSTGVTASGVARYLGRVFQMLERSGKVVN